MEKLFPDEKIIVTEYFDVHQDWEVPIPGFFIIAGIRKFRSVADMTKEEAEDFVFLLQKIRKGMWEALDVDTVYIFQNEDAEHAFHLWIFPRYNWMKEKFGIKIESIRPIIIYAKGNMLSEEHLEEVREAVRAMREYFAKN